MKFSWIVTAAASLAGANAFTTPFTTTTNTNYIGRTSIPTPSTTTTTTQLFGLADRIATKVDYDILTTEDEVRGLFKVC
jgi:hypothetical protein